jgi:hypothetical protein
VKRDSVTGNKSIDIRENKQLLTMDRVNMISKMGTGELRQLPTNEKALALKIRLDKETPNIIRGANQIKVNREFLVADSV